MHPFQGTTALRLVHLRFFRKVEKCHTPLRLRSYEIRDIKIHPVVHVIHTILHKEQPLEIAASVQPRPEPVQAEEDEEYEVEAILKHRKRGKEYPFLTLMKGGPTRC